MTARQRTHTIAIICGAALLLLAGLPASAELAWHTDFNEAVAAARDSGRPILAVFHSVGCGPCAQMEHETLADPRVAEIVARSFEAVRVNAITQSELATRYLVSYYPTVKFLDADGSAVYDAQGFITADDFLTFVDGALAAHAALQRARSAAAGEEPDAEGALAIARDFLRARQYPQAIEWARATLSRSDAADPLVTAEANSVLGIALTDAGEPAEAEEALLAALSLADDAEWAWHTRLKLGYVWLQRGREEGGIDLLSVVREAEAAAPGVRSEAERLLRWWGVAVD